jgi:hypothetical protein
MFEFGIITPFGAEIEGDINLAIVFIGKRFGSELILL